MKRFIFILLFISNVLVYSEQLKVGVLAYAPPLSSKVGKSNHYYGFVIDLMDTICQRLNHRCLYVSIPQSGELDKLDKGMVDIMFTPSPITSLVPEQYLFSLPYLASNGQFLTLKTTTINTPDEIKHKIIGFYKVNFHDSALMNKYSSTNKFIEYANTIELINALHSKHIDLILINSHATKYILNTMKVRLKLIGHKISIGNGYGVIALKRNAELINEINLTLLEMQEDGTYLKIYNKYFGSKAMDPHFQ